MKQQTQQPETLPSKEEMQNATELIARINQDIYDLFTWVQGLPGQPKTILSDLYFMGICSQSLHSFFNDLKVSVDDNTKQKEGTDMVQPDPVTV